MKESYTLTAYHCRNCGGVTRPDKEYCDYCSGKLLIKRINDAWRNHKARLLIECGENYVYLDSVLYINLYKNFDEIEFGHEKGLIFPGMKTPSSFSIDVAYNEKVSRFIDMAIDSADKIRRLRMEFLDDDTAFELESMLTIGMPENELSALLSIPIRLEPYSELKVYDTVVPENVCCPNCGARITSKYGACDYCGGWVEWSF